MICDINLLNDDRQSRSSDDEDDDHDEDSCYSFNSNKLVGLCWTDEMLTLVLLAQM